MPRAAFRNVLVATLALDLLGLGLLHRQNFVGPLLLGRFAICFAAGFAASRKPHFMRMAAAAAGATLLATVLSLFVYIATGTAAADRFGPASVFGVFVYALPAATAGFILGGATRSVAGASSEA